jgi:hypothetical protein
MIRTMFRNLIEDLLGEPKHRGDVPAWMVGFHA